MIEAVTAFVAILLFGFWILGAVVIGYAVGDYVFAHTGNYFYACLAFLGVMFFAVAVTSFFLVLIGG